MKATLTLILLLLAILSYSQAPSLNWQKSFGGTGAENALSMLQTSDSGYIIAGSSHSTNNDVTDNHGGTDYWIIKTNSIGIVQWKKSYGGTGEDIATSIQITPDSGYIVAGYSNSNNNDVSGNHGGYDYWVVKLNSVGNIQWQKSYGGSSDELIGTIQVAKDSGYIVCGHTQSNDQQVSGNHGNVDCWTVKLDKLGNIQWQKCYGGSQYEYVRYVQTTSDGSYILAGHTNSNDRDVTTNKGLYDFWIVKISSIGEIIWQKSYGGSNDDYVTSIERTLDNGYILCGQTQSNNLDVNGNHGNSDYWVVKLDSTGNLQWQKCFGGGAFDGANSIKQTADGGFVVAGYANGQYYMNTGPHGIADYWIIKLDNNGNTQWDKILGGTDDDDANSILQTKDNGYIIAGYSKSHDGNVTNNHGDSDYWIVKLGGSAIPLPLSLIKFEGFLRDNSIVLQWRTTNELNSSNFTIERSVDGVSFSTIDYIQAKGSGNAIANYEYQDKTAFQLRASRFYYRLKLIDKDGKFTYSNVVLASLSLNKPFVIYPNPAKSSFQLQLNKPVTGKANIEITDISGRMILQKEYKVEGFNITISTDKLAEGTYVVRLIYDNAEYLQKVTVVK